LSPWAMPLVRPPRPFPRIGTLLRSRQQIIAPAPFSGERNCDRRCTRRFCPRFLKPLFAHRARGEAPPEKKPAATTQRTKGAVLNHESRFCFAALRFGVLRHLLPHLLLHRCRMDVIRALRFALPARQLPLALINVALHPLGQATTQMCGRPLKRAAPQRSDRTATGVVPTRRLLGAWPKQLAPDTAAPCPSFGIHHQPRRSS